MRLFIFSLLALSAHAHSIAYRTNLLAYAPSRGEFAVDHGRAQGYVRYLDASGAERLLPYYYPEPLYGLRRLSYGVGDAVHPLLRSGLKTESSQEENALFRAWCEQRYNALKSEIERLRAEGKTPSANMMSQFEPLEKIIKAGAFESGIVSGLSADVLRAREEHYRIWNEARLKVLQAEEQQMRLYGAQYNEQKSPEDILLKQFDLQSRIDINQAKQPQIVQDTPEVLRAREEHLKLLNQAHLQQSALKGDQVQLKEYSGQSQYTQGQLPQPVQDTPEVQRAREEHLKLLKQAQLQKNTQIEQKPTSIKYTQVALPETPEVIRAREEHLKLLNEAKQKQGEQQTTYTKPYEPQAELKYTAGQLPQPVQETPEVLRAREEHLRLIEQTKLSLQSANQYNSYKDDGSYKPLSKQQVDLKYSPGVQQTIQPIVGLKTNYESTNVEQQQTSLDEEQLRLLNEAKIRIEDRFADDADRIKLEERERDSERLRELELRQEEEKQMELERLREAERLKDEQRLMAAELIALQEEEQRRIEKERNEEAERMKKEELEQLKYKTIDYESKYIAPLQQQQLVLQQQQPTPQQQQQLQQNGFFLRIQTNQPNAVLPHEPQIKGAYIIAGQQAAGAQYYIPTTHENPFLVRYTQDVQPIKHAIKPLALTALSLGDNNAAIDKQINQEQQKLKSEGSFASSSSYTSGATSSSSSSSASSSLSSIAAAGDAAGISELDKATREHFRAHEIALEQLRLANLKTPCN